MIPQLILVFVLRCFVYATPVNPAFQVSTAILRVGQAHRPDATGDVTGDEYATRTAYSQPQTAATDVAIGPNYPTSPKEMEALSKIYYSSNGPNWLYSLAYQQQQPCLSTRQVVPWNFSKVSGRFIENPCNTTATWTGLSCYCDDSTQLCHINCLSIGNPNMIGTLSPAIGSFLNATTLIINAFNLSGPLPAAIGKLTNLFTLQILGSHFESTLPAALFNFPNLISMDISGGSIVGTIPTTICQLSQARSIYLYGNQINGTIPTCLSQLLYLQSLRLNSNLLSGQIPAGLFRVTTLQLNSLLLQNNRLRGPFPQNIALMTSLGSVNFSSNSLTSSLPPSLSKLVRLSQFDVSFNLLTGSIPSLSGFVNTLSFANNKFRGNVSFLSGKNLYGSSISAAFNYLTGKIPNGLNKSGIISLQLNHNMLTSTIPSDLINPLVPTYELLLGNNLLTGTIPASLNLATELFSLDLSNNFLHGPIPTALCTLANLGSLNLSYNALTGTIPQEVSGLRSILGLDLSHNSLAGLLPTTFRNLFLLQVLMLNNNRLSGSLHSFYNASSQGQLSVINLSNNQLNGTLPASLFTLPNLYAFAAAINCIQTPLPHTICSSSVGYLVMNGLSSATACRANLLPPIFESIFSQPYLAAQGIIGGIPSCLFELPSLIVMQLSGNNIIGTLPNQVSFSNTFKNMTLSHNRISGTIPESFQARPLPWTDLSLSFNRFTGTISSNIHVQSNGSVDLIVNRLAGTVPNAIDQIANVNILSGNMFSCLQISASSSSLPKNDPDYQTYECGSDDFNFSIFVWIAVFVLEACLLSFFYYISVIRLSPYLVTLKNVISMMRTWWQSAFMNEPWHPWSSFESMPHSVMSVVAVIFRFSRGGSQASNSSAQSGTTSEPAAFNGDGVRSIEEERILSFNTATMATNKPVVEMSSKITPLLNVCRCHFVAFRRFSRDLNKLRRVLTLIFVAMMVITLPVYGALGIRYPSFSNRYAWSVSALFLEGIPAGVTVFVFVLLFLMVSAVLWFREWMCSSSDDSDEPAFIPSAGFKPAYLALLCLLVLINIVIVSAVNVLYVVGTVQFEGQSLVVFGMSLGLSLFKSFWTWLLLPKVFYLLDSQLGGQTGVNIWHMTLLLITTLLNIILIPSCVVLVVTPKCFYYLFHAPKPIDFNVVFNYQLKNCTGYSPTPSACDSVLYEYITLDVGQYDPPFTYTFECGSTLVSKYAPVFMVILLTSTLITPYLEWLVVFNYDRILEKLSCLRPILSRLIPRLFRPLRAMLETDMETNIVDRHPSSKSSFGLSNFDLSVASLADIPPGQRSSVRPNVISLGRTNGQLPQSSFTVNPMVYNNSNNVTPFETDLSPTNPSLLELTNSSRTTSSVSTANNTSRAASFRGGSFQQIGYSLKVLGQQTVTAVDALLDVNHNYQSFNYFDLSGLVVRIFTILSICFTFGLAYPVLGILGLFAMHMMTYTKQLQVARIWHEAIELENANVLAALASDCRGLTTLVWRAALLIFPIPFLFFAFLILDISGNLSQEPTITWAIGWPSVVLVVIPYTTLAIYYAYKLWKRIPASATATQGGNVVP